MYATTDQQYVLTPLGWHLGTLSLEGKMLLELGVGVGLGLGLGLWCNPSSWPVPTEQQYALTPLGWHLGTLPLDARLGKMLLQLGVRVRVEVMVQPSSFVSSSD